MSKPAHYQTVYRKQLLDKIESIDTQVFNRDDLDQDHSNKTQLCLNRALKAFMEEGIIIKISHNLYAKAMKLNLTKNDLRIVLRAPFEKVAVEALDKLGIEWEYGQAIQEYNRGETTQIPTVFSVRLRSRFRGSISAEGRSVVFEDGRNAR